VNDFRLGFVRINNSDINVPPVTASQADITRPTSNLTDSIYKFTFVSSGFSSVLRRKPISSRRRTTLIS